MRILFWTGKYWPDIGGTATFATRLLPALQERGHEILVVAAQSHQDHPLQDSYQGIPVKRFPFWDPKTYQRIDHVFSVKKDVAHLKRKFSPDLIHLSSLNLSHFFHLETASIYQAPVIVTVHGYHDFNDGGAYHLTSLEEKVLAAANWVTGVSGTIMENFRKLLPVIRTRSTVIHNGMELPPVLPGPLPFAPPVLLCIGRLVKEKGIDVALAAFPQILRHFPQTRMMIAGDGPERPSLEQQTRSLGIRESVDFLGWVSPDNVPDLINTATVVVVPSRWEEPFGFVALEAGLMARPVVATRVGGLQEIIIHSKTGSLVTNEDSHEMGNAILSLLGNFTVAERMGLAARQHITKNFSLTSCVDAYEALYQKIGASAANHLASKGSQVAIPK